MADFIGSRTPAKWFQVESLEDVPLCNKKVPLGRKLVLVDTHYLDRGALSSLFLSSAWINNSDNLMALYNLRHEHEIEKEALRRGVRGFLYVNDAVKNLVKGICTINSGDLWISRRIISQCLFESYMGRNNSTHDNHLLSEREEEVLRILAAGASNHSIAKQLHISEHTVKTHLHNIFKKVGVKNRLQAVIWANEHL